jgi:hypothetical protein
LPRRDAASSCLYSLFNPGALGKFALTSLSPLSPCTGASFEDFPKQ